MTFNNKPNIIVICGPTGIGKTSSAIKLAKIFNGEIINADSMQIYKYMNIGTAKPTSHELSEIPHHLIDIIEPDESFDAACFAKLAHEKIMMLDNKKITPFIAGGTGFYIKALVQGIFESQPVNNEIRQKLKQEAEKFGSMKLYERLQKCDVNAAEKIHPNDTYRIIRALEIYETTGKTISQYHARHGFADNPFNVLKIGLHMEREALYERINKRVDIMIDQGLKQEVSSLLDMGYVPELKSMQSIGYRHMVDFLYKKIDWEEAVRTMKRDTRRYAKRQFTWFKADPKIIWIHPDDVKDMKPIIKKFLQK